MLTVSCLELPAVLVPCAARCVVWCLCVHVAVLAGGVAGTQRLTASAPLTKADYPALVIHTPADTYTQYVMYTHTHCFVQRGLLRALAGLNGMSRAKYSFKA